MTESHNFKELSQKDQEDIKKDLYKGKLKASILRLDKDFAVYWLEKLGDSNADRLERYTFKIPYSDITTTFTPQIEAYLLIRWLEVVAYMWQK